SRLARNLLVAQQLRRDADRVCKRYDHCQCYEEGPRPNPEIDGGSNGSNTSDALISRVWTIGDSTRPIQDFIAALEAYGIKLLVDVRTLPASKRYPQFNKEALAKSLKEHGIHYEHFAELGGRRKPRPDSRNTAWRN